MGYIKLSCGGVPHDGLRGRCRSRGPGPRRGTPPLGPLLGRRGGLDDHAHAALEGIGQSGNEKIIVDRRRGWAWGRRGAFKERRLLVLQKLLGELSVLCHLGLSFKLGGLTLCLALYNVGHAGGARLFPVGLLCWRKLPLGPDFCRVVSDHYFVYHKRKYDARRDRRPDCR